MKNNRNQGGLRGFTLVEVIVVLVVLAIIAAIMIPAMTGWIDEANAKRCLSQMGDVRRDYQAFAAYNAYDVDDANALLGEAVTEILGETASGSSFPDGMGGTCTATYTADNTAIADISCSLHGSLSGGEASRRAVMEDGINKAMGSGELMIRIQEYFTKYSGVQNLQLDSTGPNTGVPIIRPLLADLGLPATASDFAMVKTNDGKLVVYWTNADIAAAKNGDKIPYIKYTYKYSTLGTTPERTDDEPQSGMVEVKTNRTHSNSLNKDVDYNRMDLTKTVPDAAYGDSLN